MARVQRVSPPWACAQRSARASGTPARRATIIAAFARFVDAQAPSAELLPIESSNGAVRLPAIHLYEAEAPRPASLAVGDELLPIGPSHTARTAAGSGLQRR